MNERSNGKSRLRNIGLPIFMMRRILAIIVLLVATSAFCFGDGYGDVSFIESHWQIFTNISRFREFYSPTNLPPEVRSNLVYTYKAHTASGLVDPGVTITDGSHLVWGATDGTNYVVYWEVAFGSNLQDAFEASGWSDCCITAAVREAESTNLVLSTVWCFNRLKNYKEFVDYRISGRDQPADFPQ
jgi:hypothetical protein